MSSDVGSGGLAIVLDVQSWVFLLKKIGFAQWPDTMLNQKLMYYWQEIFLLTLTSDTETEAILNDTIALFVD